MWHTISRQLTWASECQPIGCAITPLSDISIAALPCITLKQQGAEIRMLPVRLRQKSVSVCLFLTSYRFRMFPYMILLLSPYVSMHFWAHEHFLYLQSFLFFFPLCLIISPSYIGNHVIFLPICLLFVHLFIWKWSMSCTKTLWCVCTSAWTYVIGSMLWKGLWCVCIWRRPAYRDDLSIKSY